MDEAEYKKQMEEVKQNCPFCKIIKGEIPSKKVYEDDKLIAILDINPHRKGHTLVVPKEHYPILPLVPPDVFSHLFKITKELSKACAKATANPYSNVFVANGAAAGQQSQHFMLHVIPNETKGGFDISLGKATDEEINKTFEIFSNNLPLMIKNHFSRNPELALKEKPKQNVEQNHINEQLDNPSVFASLTVEQIADTLMSNKEVLDVLLADSEKFKSMVPSHPQLSQMFTKVSVDDVIKLLKERVSGAESNVENKDLDSVVDIIMKNDLVRDAMFQDLGKFKQLIPQNESLSKLFANVNIDEVFNQLKVKIGR